MENIDHNDGVVDDLYSYRQKPKDGERMYALEAEYRSHCCSILSDRKVTQKEIKGTEEDFFTITYYLLPHIMGV